MTTPPEPLAAQLRAARRALADLVALAEHAERTLAARPPDLSDLTTREREILAALASGERTPALAARYDCSPRTITTHVERILRKLACPNRTAAAALAGAARHAQECPRCSIRSSN